MRALFAVLCVAALVSAQCSEEGLPTSPCAQCQMVQDGGEGHYACISCENGYHVLAEDCELNTCSGHCTLCNEDVSECYACEEGWSGNVCTTPICPSGCSECTSPDECTACSDDHYDPTKQCAECNANWKGEGCTTPVCSSDACTCTNPNECTGCTNDHYDPASNCASCTSNWKGNDCNTPVCASDACTCTNPGECTACTNDHYDPASNCVNCLSTYTGNQCETPVCGIEHCSVCSDTTHCGTCEENFVPDETNEHCVPESHDPSSIYTSLTSPGDDSSLSAKSYSSSHGDVPKTSSVPVKPSSSDEDDDDTNVGMIVGIVIGALVLLVIIGAAVWCILTNGAKHGKVDPVIYEEDTDFISMSVL